MLENSLWLRYNPTKTIQEMLIEQYGCDAVDIESDERALYASLKRHLTKKEFRLIMMNEAGLDLAIIGNEIGVDGEELAKAHYKAYRKLRQDKIRLEVRANKQQEVYLEPTTNEK